MNLAYRLAATLAYSVPLPASKLARARAAWVTATERWERWGNDHRTAAPLVWLHAASVGEFLVLEPIITRLQRRFPNVQIAQTYSSTSMETWPAICSLDHSDYRPAERAHAIKRFLSALRPSVMVVSRGELWPEMVHGALGQNIQVIVAGATIRPRSKRLQQPFRTLLRPLYRNLSWVGAISPDDARRWTKMGVPRERILVTGDPRHDQILERPRHADRFSELTAWLSEGEVMVGGSTHSPDEKLLLDGLKHVARRHSSAKLVLAPHEASSTAASRAVQAARSRGFTASAWKGGSVDHDTNVLVVDKPNVLADLYSVATLAYVGGGFGSSGVHSIAEAAAFGIPILTGPGGRRDVIARPFVDAGGAIALGREKPLDELVAKWGGWLDDPRDRTVVGGAARGQLRGGASDVTLKMLSAILDPAGNTPVQT